MVVSRKHSAGVRRAVAAMSVVSLVVFAVACGSERGSSSSTSAPNGAAAPYTTVPDDQLRSMLLTTEDLPAGWADVPSSTTDTAAATMADPTADICPEAAKLVKEEEHATVNASFAQYRAGPYFLEALSSAPDADQHLANIDAAMATCVGHTWTTETSGVTLEMNMKESDALHVGDQSSGYEVMGTGEDAGVTATIGFELAFVRRGGIVEQYAGISAAASTSQESTLNPKQFTEMVASGDQKVAAGPGATATTSSTGVPLTRADFIAQANSICRATHDKVGQLFEDNPIGSQDLRLYLIRLGPQVTALLKDMLSQLRQLQPPTADAVQIERGWNEMKALINELELDPTWAFNQMFPKDQALYDYGLTDCFVTHVDVL